MVYLTAFLGVLKKTYQNIGLEEDIGLLLLLDVLQTGALLEAVLNVRLEDLVKLKTSIAKKSVK